MQPGTPDCAPKLSTHTYRLFIFLKNRCFHPAAKRCAFYRIKILCQAPRAKNSKPTRQNRCTVRKKHHPRTQPPHYAAPSKATRCSKRGRIIKNYQRASRGLIKKITRSSLARTSACQPEARPSRQRAAATLYQRASLHSAEPLPGQSFAETLTYSPSSQPA